MRLRHAAILMLAGVVLAAPAFADEVTDQITKALNAYQHHDTHAALVALDAASSHLRHQRADQLKVLLPPPPADWTADPPETSAVSATMLGGGTTASRTYRQGDQQVKVELTTDSPMLQQMAELVNSPLGMASDSQSVTISGQKVSYTARDNDFMALVGTVIVKVSGNAQVPKATLRTFLEAVDFPALAKLAH